MTHATTTARELIHELSRLDPDRPVIVYAYGIDKYLNIATADPVDEIDPTEATAAVIIALDNFDTRQW